MSLKISETIEIDDIGGNCPVQAEGRIADVPFYFRARGARCQIWIGATPMSDDCWHLEEPCGEGFEAGWIGEEEALAFIEAGAKRFLEECDPAPQAAFAAYLNADGAWKAELAARFGKEAIAAVQFESGRGAPGSELRRLSDARDAALAEWERLKDGQPR